MSDDSETERKSSGRKEKIAIITIAAAVILAITTVSTLGINTGQKLHYGNVTYDTNVTKFLQVNADRKSLLNVESRGNISRHLDFQERHYFEGNKTLSVKIGSKEPGYYEGKLRLNFQVPETRWASKWISLKYMYS